MKKLLLVSLCLLSFSAFASEQAVMPVSKAPKGDSPPQTITCREAATYPAAKQMMVYATAAGYIAGRDSLRDKKAYFRDDKLTQTITALKRYCVKNPDNTVASFVEK